MVLEPPRRWHRRTGTVRVVSDGDVERGSPASYGRGAALVRVTLDGFQRAEGSCVGAEVRGVEHPRRRIRGLGHVEGCLEVTTQSELDLVSEWQSLSRLS